MSTEDCGLNFNCIHFPVNGKLQQNFFIHTYSIDCNYHEGMKRTNVIIIERCQEPRTRQNIKISLATPDDTLISKLSKRFHFLTSYPLLHSLTRPIHFNVDQEKSGPNFISFIFKVSLNTV